MYSVGMCALAVAAFIWGLSLVSYRWVALQNAWPMGVWQAERPLLPRLIGLAVIVAALVGVALELGGSAMLLVVLLGLAGTVIWTAALRTAAQSALLLAPAAVAVLWAGRLIGGG